MPSDKKSPIANNQRNIEHLEQEYQDFVYAVSHDFRAPLRHIKSFTEFLVESRGDPNEEEQEYIEYIQNAMQKLENMHKGLVQLSRIPSIPQDWKTVDCTKLVKTIIDDFFKNDNHHIEIEPLPVINGDARYINTLFYNLIDNAIKFHATDDASPKHVHISATASQDGFVFEITDNGIGIDEKHREDVFKVFKRLKTDQYPGIGAGLTIAQKIVRLHGGHIWIDAPQDQGTVVKFSLQTA